MANPRRVFGVGINDSDYPTRLSRTEMVDGKKKYIVEWQCPIYQTWGSMIRRCYSQVLKRNRPTYENCTVHQDWLKFSNFRKWMIKQDWVDKHLDKDLLIKGNKHYSPETCVFVSVEVNSFINENEKVRNDLPLGVNLHKRDLKYYSTISEKGKKKHLGIYDSAEAAHQRWLLEKKRLAEILADKQSDERISNALRTRY